MKLITMIIFGLLGFWIISWLLERSSKKPPSRPATEKKAAASDDFAHAGAYAKQGSTDGDDPLAGYCAELELHRPYSVSELKEAYRRKIAEYHPDKVSRLGKELRDLAEAKSKAINIAYEQLLPHASR